MSIIDTDKLLSAFIQVKAFTEAMDCCQRDQIAGFPLLLLKLTEVPLLL